MVFKYFLYCLQIFDSYLSPLYQSYMLIIEKNLNLTLART